VAKRKIEFFISQSVPPRRRNSLKIKNSIFLFADLMIYTFVDLRE